MKKDKSHRRQFTVGNKIDIEKKMVPSIAIVGMIISSVGLFVNLPMHLGYKLTLVAIASFIMYAAIYIISKADRYRGLTDGSW